MKDKEMGREMPWEKQRELLMESDAIRLPQLYWDLIAVYGESQGKKMYEELYDVSFKRRAAPFIGKDVEDIMEFELNFFPALGWKIWIERKEENGEPVWYEHLDRCPHLDACSKYNLPLPCEQVCDMDVKFGQRYKLATWQRLKHMPSGDSECMFRLTRCK